MQDTQVPQPRTINVTNNKTALFIPHSCSGVQVRKTVYKYLGVHFKVKHLEGRVSISLF